MCGISGSEFLIIIVAAIIIMGPEKLPDLMRMAGKLARDVRRIRGDLGDVTKEIRSQVNVKDLQDQLTKELEIDRARERMREAESEVDALRARMKKKIDVGADAQASSGVPTIRPAAGALAQGEDPEPSVDDSAFAESTIDGGSDAAPEVPRRTTTRAVGAPSTAASVDDIDAVPAPSTAAPEPVTEPQTAGGEA